MLLFTENKRRNTGIAATTNPRVVMASVSPFSDLFGSVEGTFIVRGSSGWGARFIVGSDLPNPAIADLGGVFALPYGSSAGANNGPYTTTSVLAGIDLSGNPQRAAVTGSAGPVVLQNAPTLVTPNATSGYYLNSTVALNDASNYRILYSSDGRDAFNAGNATVSNVNLHKATTHSIASGVGLQFAQFDATGLTVTAQNASALKVGRLGGTTPAFQVDSATASSITGVKVTAAATTGGVAVAAIGETNVALNVDAAGSGQIVLNATGTGNVVSKRNITIDKATSGTIQFGTSGNVQGILSASGTTGMLFQTVGGSLISTFVPQTSASDVNYISFNSNQSGGGVFVQALSSVDTNINFSLIAKGAGSVLLSTGGGTIQAQVSHTASADRYVTLTGSNGGNPAIAASAGRVTLNGVDISHGVANSIKGNNTGSTAAVTDLTGANVAALIGNPLLQFSVAVDFNSVGDNAIAITLPTGITRYRIQGIITINNGTTASLTTAQYGVFTSTGGGGTAVVASGTALSSITSNAAATATSMAIAGPAITAWFTNATLYYRVTQAQGAAASGYAILQIAPLA